jgi:hypothetical protein
MASVQEAFRQLPGVKAITAPGQPCSVGSGDIAIPSDSTAMLAPKDSPGAAVGGAPSVDSGDMESRSDSTGCRSLSVSIEQDVNDADMLEHCEGGDDAAVGLRGRNHGVHVHRAARPPVGQRGPQRHNNCNGLSSGSCETGAASLFAYGRYLPAFKRLDADEHSGDHLGWLC